MGSPERLTLTTPQPESAATPSESRPVRASSDPDGPRPTRVLPVAVAWSILVASVAARVALAVLVGLALWAVVPTVLGQTATVVMSDSMAPGLRSGDVVIAHPSSSSEVRFGQVLLVTDPDRPERLRLHRLIGKRDGELILRGDANPAADTSPVHPSAVRAVGVLRVPIIGLPLLWMRTGQPLLVAAALLALVLLVAVMKTERLLPGGEAELRRGQRAATAALVVTLLVPLVTAPPDPSSADAVFSAKTMNSGASWATTAVACTPVTYPTTPYLRYSFENTSGGTAETNTQGSSHTGTLGSGVTRVSSNCAPTTAFVRLDGTSNGYIASQTSITIPVAPTSLSLGIWYRTSASGITGRIAGLSQFSGATASTSEYAAAIYLDKANSGRITFAVTTTATAYSCAINGSGPNDGAWHYAVGIVAPGGINLYNDPSNTVANTSNSCSRTLTGRLANGGYWRAGADTLTNYSATTPPTWSGDLDEMAVWSSALSYADAKAVYTLGH